MKKKASGGKDGKAVKPVKAKKAAKTPAVAKAGRAGRAGKADRELLEQIKAAVGDEGLVQAVFMLRLPPGRPPAPKGIEKTARRVLNRVARSVGTAASDFNVFGNLGAFAVRAAPVFVHALLGEPEVVSAVANRRPDEVLIRPRGKRPDGKQAGSRKARSKHKPVASRKKRQARKKRRAR